MKKLSMICLLTLSLIMGYQQSAHAIEAFETPTGVLKWNKEKAFDGYTLLSPNTGTNSYLIDMEGNIVHEWKTNYRPGLYAELLPNGNLLRGYREATFKVPFGGATTGIQELDWEGNVVWQFTPKDPDQTTHHCFKRLPNGNTLVLVWERKSTAEAYEKGRAKGTLPEKDELIYDGQKYGEIWPDALLEIDAQGNEVWSWHVWDHIGMGEDQFNINYILPNSEYYTTSDWTHFNSIDYIPETNQILLCSRNFGEIFLLNKDTGKIEFRWGNPSNRGKGIAPSWLNAHDQQLFGPHNATWLGNNKIMIFDNGWQNPENNRSRIVIIDVKTKKIVWEYTAINMNSFYSAFQGAAQKLPNGNIFVTSSNTGHIFEITCEDKPEVVWEYINPFVKGVPTALLTEADAVRAEKNLILNYTHRSYRYAKDFSGFTDKKFSEPKNLFPDAPVWRELYEKARALKAQ